MSRSASSVGSRFYGRLLLSISPQKANPRPQIMILRRITTASSPSIITDEKPTTSAVRAYHGHGYGSRNDDRKFPGRLQQPDAITRCPTRATQQPDDTFLLLRRQPQKCNNSLSSSIGTARSMHTGTYSRQSSAGAAAKGKEEPEAEAEAEGEEYEAKEGGKDEPPFEADEQSGDNQASISPNKAMIEEQELKWAAKVQELSEYYNQYEQEHSGKNEAVEWIFPDEEKFEVNTQRGLTGVFDVEDLVQFLDIERCQDIVTIDTEEDEMHADYMVICCPFSDRHMAAVFNQTVKLYKAKKHRSDPSLRVPNYKPSPFDEGPVEDIWRTLNLGNIILHFIVPSAREHYDLEQLWAVGEDHDSERSDALETGLFDHDQMATILGETDSKLIEPFRMHEFHPGTMSPKSHEAMTDDMKEWYRVRSELINEWREKQLERTPNMPVDDPRLVK